MALVFVGLLPLLAYFMFGYIQNDNFLGVVRAPVNILCFGDSLTAGWSKSKSLHGSPSVVFTPYSKALEKALGKGFHTISIGFPGWTTRDLLRASQVNSSDATESIAERPGLAEAIKQHRPALAIIMAGTNDIFKDNDIDGNSIASRVWQLHCIAHDAGVRTIALGIPNWSNSCQYHTKAPYTNEQRITTRAELNKRLSKYVYGVPQRTLYVDFPFAFAGSSKNWDNDGLHLSPEGYSELGMQLAKSARDFILSS
jgi:lysophospholipase L1-like esterase